MRIGRSHWSLEQSVSLRSETGCNLHFEDYRELATHAIRSFLGAEFGIDRDGADDAAQVIVSRLIREGRESWTN